ncbi:EARP and GARP complex-interacting protein 1-like [Clavelina lepadiformis]|uniref:EARP and GARP complex-interacting protein 1-like n=1 Tax=Clavelina lepadiformis TaxID=159417 RepID=UPI00404142F3
MDVEDAPLIYGLELQARCLCPQAAETNYTRFLVATQSLRQENQVHLITFDDENNQLEKTIFPHTSGEVWHISSSCNDVSLFSTCFNHIAGGDIRSGCKLWRLPADQCNETVTDSLNQPNSISEIGELKSDEVRSVSHVLWKPIEDDSQVMSLGSGQMHLWDIMKAEPRLIRVFKLPEKKGHPCPVTNGKWNPHHGAKQFAVATNQHIIGWDVRGDAEAFRIENAHGQLVRDLDFNPNKQYYLVSCGDDCLVKFWDVREPTAPVSVISDEHSHWVWSARFNPFHDQLVLSCGSDSRVVLFNKASLSSEPFGHLMDEDEDDLGSEKEPPKDGLIEIYEEHEDSVYAVEWSSADPWSFASLSYDGRVVINKVPKKVKFDILL